MWPEIKQLNAGRPGSSSLNFGCALYGSRAWVHSYVQVLIYQAPKTFLGCLITSQTKCPLWAEVLLGRPLFDGNDKHKDAGNAVCMHVRRWKEEGGQTSPLMAKNRQSGGLRRPLRRLPSSRGSPLGSSYNTLDDITQDASPIFPVPLLQASPARLWLQKPHSVVMENLTTRLEAPPLTYLLCLVLYFSPQ